MGVCSIGTEGREGYSGIELRIEQIAQHRLLLQTGHGTFMHSRVLIRIQTDILLWALKANHRTFMDSQSI